MVATYKEFAKYQDKYADQPGEHVALLPLLNCHGWKQLIFKSVGICKMFYALLWIALYY